MKLLRLLSALFRKSEPKPKFMVLEGAIHNEIPSFDYKKYIEMRNQILRAYLLFNDAMLEAKNVKELEEVATAWAQTTDSITQVLKTVFRLTDEKDIKDALKTFEAEIIKVIDSTSIPDGDSGGGINYTGPKGEA